MSQIESAGPTALNPSSTGLPTLPKIHLETSVGQDQAQILDRTTNKPSDQETLEAMDALPPITDSASLASFDLRAASGDSGKTGRRRKSVLQSMLFSENLEAHRVISDKDHGLKSILDQQLSEMTRVFRLIKEKESGLGQEASSGAESASPLRKLTMELNKSTYAFQPPRVSQVAISKSSTVLDRPGSSRASFGARPISGQSPLWSLDQALKEAEAEDVNDASGIKKQLQKVLKDRNRVLDHWNLVKTQIQQAKSSAAEEEKLREQEALKGFSSLKFDSSMLPSIKVPLKLDNIDFEKFGLLSSPQNSNLEEEKEVPVDQKIKDLLNKIKQHDISRTDSRVKRVWFIDPKKKMIAMDQEGVLEAEADLVAAPHGALEIPKHGPVRKNVPYSPEAREILKRMNWRINYLKNPRFKLKPMEEQQATSVNLPQPSSAATTIRSYGTIQTGKTFLLSK